jgi:hypothetical protein
MRLSLAAYCLTRVLEVDGCCSAMVFATRGLAAGSVLAVIELRVLLLEAGERMISIALYSRLSVYVDDATIETICLQRSIVEQHSKAVNCFAGHLESMRLPFSATKNVTSATTDALARVVNGAIAGISIKVASRVTSLGTGLGAGRRRNMVQVRKR